MSETRRSGCGFRFEAAAQVARQAAALSKRTEGWPPKRGKPRTEQHSERRAQAKRSCGPPGLC
jgi:hypothetical protein